MEKIEWRISTREGKNQDERKPAKSNFSTFCRFYVEIIFNVYQRNVNSGRKENRKGEVERENGRREENG